MKRLPTALHARSRWFTAVAASALAIGVAAIGLPQSASAAPIPNAITSVELSVPAQPIHTGDTVGFRCTWAVPDHSQPGDTFTLQLPSELSWNGRESFPLADDTGNVVANASVDPAGLVTFTLTSFVATHPLNVHGSCAFNAVYTATSQPVPTMTFTVGGSVVRVPYTFEPVCPRDCGNTIDTADKVMWWTDNSQTQTMSGIRVPVTTESSNSVTIVDRPGPGLALDCSHAWSAIGRHIDSHGNLTAPYDDGLYQPTAWSCDPHQATLSFTDIPAGEYVQLWIASTMTDPTLASYSNSGTVTVNGVNTVVSAKATHTDASGNATGNGTPTTPPIPPTPAAKPTSTAPLGASVSTGGAVSATSPRSPFVVTVAIALAGIAALAINWQTRRA